MHADGADRLARRDGEALLQVAGVLDERGGGAFGRAGERVAEVLRMGREALAHGA